MDIVFKELFSTDIGLLSLFTIGFIIAMGFWFSWWFKRKMDRDE
jgi:hypothetical protein